MDEASDDPVPIAAARGLGQQVQFVDCKAPGADLKFRSGIVVAMKDTQVVIQEAQRA